MWKIWENLYLKWCKNRDSELEQYCHHKFPCSKRVRELPKFHMTSSESMRLRESIKIFLKYFSCSNRVTYAERYCIDKLCQIIGLLRSQFRMVSFTMKIATQNSDWKRHNAIKIQHLLHGDIEISMLSLKRNNNAGRLKYLKYRNSPFFT